MWAQSGLNWNAIEIRGDWNGNELRDAYSSPNQQYAITQLLTKRDSPQISPLAMQWLDYSVSALIAVGVGRKDERIHYIYFSTDFSSRLVESAGAQDNLKV